MKKKTTLGGEAYQALFRQLMAGTRRVKQDTIVHRPQRKKVSEVPVKRLIRGRHDASHYFSDEFQPLLNTEGPVKYVHPDVSHFEAKKLRRGDYSPELFGFTRSDAAAGQAGTGGVDCRLSPRTCILRLRDAWSREAYFEATNTAVAGTTSACHGVSQAAKEYGDDAALLVLIEVEEWLPPELP